VTAPALGETLDVATRDEWRAWLAEHHATADEIWLVYHRKATGRARIPYADAVEEALCFGWIDSIHRGLDETSTAQRFTPRRRGSSWSALNRERARKLLAAGRMEPAGVEALGDALAGDADAIPADIESALRRDPAVWRTFDSFPASYRRVRVGYVDGARGRPEEFDRRLRHLVRMTALGKRFGSEA
jgi:uncharacterized protein YdeI (YjbR/CyaY-like superfamily)